MAANNPFCLSFGREPDRFIERGKTYTKIKETFDSISPSVNSFIITGVRGSGKTVLLATIANEYRENNDWLVVSLNPTRNMLEMLAGGLYETCKALQNGFIEKSVNLSKFGIGVEIKNVPPISDIQIAIVKMLDIVKKSNKRVLITIDDATKSNDIITFACAFQDFISQNYPVYLLMTGLYENIKPIKDDKRCSFFTRAEQRELAPLDIIKMKNQYEQTFNCSEAEATRMAAFTKGYSYAFQALGYIMWDEECSLDDAIPYFDERMSEYCYDKIWEDLPNKEREFIKAIGEKKEEKVKDIMANMGINNSQFSVYRDRLIKKGIVTSNKYGYLSLTLPRFGEYVTLKQILEDY